MLNQTQLWEREYGSLRVIPSSTRELPSKALQLFSEILDFTEPRKILDAGCGIGRNAIYLARKGAEVHAVDMSPTALRHLDRAALSAGVRKQIIVHQQALDIPFPFENNFFDLVLDSYVSCHFTDDQFKEGYRQQLHRVTKPGGFVFSSQFSVEDEYYAKILEDNKDGGKLVTDPRNEITKRLYAGDEIKNFFRVEFEIPYFVKLEFDDEVQQTVYRRSIFAIVLRKPI